MFDIPHAPTALHRFAQDYNQSIQHAALLLGGQSWLRRTQRLLDDLKQPRPVSRRMLREAFALLSLLMLENVHDFESVEAEHFAEIDPASAVVDEICLLTEALSSALSAVAEAPDSTPSEHKEVAHV